MTLSLIRLSRSWWRITILLFAPPCLLLSRWDSTRRRVQSPNPVEILSRKSPEKLRLPQPTDRDRATLRPKDDDDAWLPPLGLSSSWSLMVFIIVESSSWCRWRLICGWTSVNPLLSVVAVAAEEEEEEEERERKDQKDFLRGLSAATRMPPMSPTGLGATDLLRFRESAAAGAAEEGTAGGGRGGGGGGGCCFFL